ncbi:TPA: hypothetical protein O8T91_002161 [Enterobacter cloacae]|uniref:hypothetical protein n=1 Tax=Enterobacter cloacae complex TaxID=354276 RepID=UPI003C6C7C1E|nr:hypothetical protein [Enterobacter cloacae]
MSSKYEDLIKNARINADCGEHMSPEEVTTLLNVVETTFAALASENAGLKKFCKDAAFDADYEAELGMERGGFTDALNDIKTPATDAFLAEVRASGVEMFAQKCDLKASQSLSSDISDNWKLLGEHASDFANGLRKGVQS